MVGLHKSRIRNDNNQMEKGSLKFNQSRTKTPLFVRSNGKMHFQFDQAIPPFYEGRSG